MTDSTENARPKIPVPLPRAEAKIAVPVPHIDDADAAAAAKWGRVDDDGNVWLRSAGSEPERVVGQYAAGGTETDALGLYVRRYLDIKAQVVLLESRVAKISPEEARKSLKSLKEQLVEPAVVGDVEELRNRVQALEAKIEERAAQVAIEREEAKAKALADRTAIVERVEEIAAQDPGKTHWRNSRDELTKLLDQWKNAQRHGARLDRTTEDGLWKRFSAARTQFDRHRRQYFSDLEAQHKETIRTKEALIAQAQALQTSTDWNDTAAQYRNLMDQWKRAGRSTRKDDDRLWEQFRSAQQVFFDARSSFNAALDEEFGSNLEKKLALLEQAERILPIEDIAAAKEQLRAIGEQWDAIGRVPRADVARTEGRLREIERIIRDAENEQWAKTDPDKEERTSGMAQQLQQLITELEAQLAQAQADSNAKKIKEYEEALAARKAWLKAVLDD
ncbi:hypothetical protein JOD55_001288 [Arcanobacterium pluranimalium]|uniref:DUF349 domain-containing protein n=1 Tax=Arcanobacterium pluranimalium TaxID=108028 RepID=UPI00195A3687|nr:DUF349 domain-containing protein [Arcanobacterium pluranimalium]MBM7825461.1 hypothetical protein [Arcanobacterium pluranimalium]